MTMVKPWLLALSKLKSIALPRLLAVLSWVLTHAAAVLLWLDRRLQNLRQ